MNEKFVKPPPAPAFEPSPVVCPPSPPVAEMLAACTAEVGAHQLEHAVAIATGVVGYLLNKPIPAYAAAPGRVPVATGIADSRAETTVEQLLAFAGAIAS